MKPSYSTKKERLQKQIQNAEKTDKRSKLTVTDKKKINNIPYAILYEHTDSNYTDSQTN